MKKVLAVLVVATFTLGFVHGQDSGTASQKPAAETRKEKTKDCSGSMECCKMKPASAKQGKEAKKEEKATEGKKSR